MSARTEGPGHVVCASPEDDVGVIGLFVLLAVACVIYAVQGLHMTLTGDDR